MPVTPAWGHAEGGGRLTRADRPHPACPPAAPPAPSVAPQGFARHAPPACYPGRRHTCQPAGRTRRRDNRPGDQQSRRGGARARVPAAVGGGKALRESRLAVAEAPPPSASARAALSALPCELPALRQTGCCTTVRCRTEDASILFFLCLLSHLRKWCLSVKCARRVRDNARAMGLVRKDYYK